VGGFGAHVPEWDLVRCSDPMAPRTWRYGGGRQEIIDNLGRARDDTPAIRGRVRRKAREGVASDRSEGLP